MADEQVALWQQRSERLHTQLLDCAADYERFAVDLAQMQQQVEDAKGKLSSLRNQLSQCENDLRHWREAHGSEYAYRRLTELRKFLEDYDHSR